MAVGDSYHDVTWGTRRFADWIIPNAIRDKNLQERAVMRDTTNWVLVRPAGLSDGPLSRDGTPGYLAGPNAAPASYKTIARANVADFILSKCLSGMDEWKRYPVTVYPPQ
jgi:NAD(P)H-binding